MNIDEKLNVLEGTQGVDEDDGLSQPATVSIESEQVQTLIEEIQQLKEMIIKTSKYQQISPRRIRTLIKKFAFSLPDSNQCVKLEIPVESSNPLSVEISPKTMKSRIYLLEDQLEKSQIANAVLKADLQDSRFKLQKYQSLVNCNPC